MSTYLQNKQNTVVQKYILERFIKRLYNTRFSGITIDKNRYWNGQIMNITLSPTIL